MLKERTKNKYLVSAWSVQEAKGKARDRGIDWEQCTYIPENENYRWQKIEALHGFKKEELIGFFSEEEIFWLTCPIV